LGCGRITRLEFSLNLEIRDNAARILKTRIDRLIEVEALDKNLVELRHSVDAKRSIRMLSTL
jgi:hypothetical protein